MRVLLISGPNVNLIGKRESRIYGSESYESIMQKCKKYSSMEGIRLDIFHSNHEGAIIDRIQKNDFDFIVGNFGAYTHYSYAIRDAILAVDKPLIEVHVSNVFAREEWRKKSVFSDISIGVITGFGGYSYILALKYLVELEEK